MILLSLLLQITVADLSGVPFMRVSTLTWRGVVPEGEAVGPTDVGAFRWVRGQLHTALGW